MAAQQVETYSDKPSHHHQQQCQGNAEEELDLQRPWAGAEGSVSHQECYDLAATDMREIRLSQAGAGAFSHIAEGRVATKLLYFNPHKVDHRSSFLLLKMVLKIEMAACSFCFHLVLFPPYPSTAICFSTGSSLLTSVGADRSPTWQVHAKSLHCCGGSRECSAASQRLVPTAGFDP